MGLGVAVGVAVEVAVAVGVGVNVAVAVGVGLGVGVGVGPPAPPRKIPDMTAVSPAVFVAVIETDPPLETWIGNDTQEPPTNVDVRSST